MSDLAITFSSEEPKSAYDYRHIYLEQNPANRKKFVFFLSLLRHRINRQMHI